jgi:hypothetical protein
MLGLHSSIRMIDSAVKGQVEGSERLYGSVSPILFAVWHIEHHQCLDSANVAIARHSSVLDCLNDDKNVHFSHVRVISLSAPATAACRSVASPCAAVVRLLRFWDKSSCARCMSRAMSACAFVTVCCIVRVADRISPSNLRVC